jgi:formylmethanofuran dehydrogenase subunit E
MLLTGCTLGKGNLIYRNYGKQVYTFGSRNSRQALHITLKGELFPKQSSNLLALRNKVSSGAATPVEKQNSRKYIVKELSRFYSKLKRNYLKLKR